MLNSRRAGSVVAPSFPRPLQNFRVRNVEVGGGQMHSPIARLKQYVRKNRQSRPCADDVLDLLQTFQQFSLVALNFMRTIWLRC